ncbi:unnamed protein product [Nippostrongylus brasiliensis]|uniref:Uncharacterized protein n=1 Tax=Nippostrongylus brasiliensis TaxID=27835 RepID=A0A0N4XFJ2_NIPBR|nr:unnamed protein product [Nippostrongylus brasiliensis]
MPTSTNGVNFFNPTEDDEDDQIDRQSSTQILDSGIDDALDSLKNCSLKRIIQLLNLSFCPLKCRAAVSSGQLLLLNKQQEPLEEVEATLAQGSTPPSNLKQFSKRIVSQRQVLLVRQPGGGRAQPVARSLVEKTRKTVLL